MIVLRKRQGEQSGYQDEIVHEIRDEVERQIKDMIGLNDQMDAARGENIFNDADLQMAGYAAALRVLTAYTKIDGKDMTQEALRPRKRGEKTLVDELTEFAVQTANEFLVPDGLERELWLELNGAERFYLKMMDIEEAGEAKLDQFQNFAKAFDITFQARDKSLQHVWTTSWGVSTRLIGGVIMTHGDDSGLVLPPRVAPHQVVIVPIPRGNWQETVLPKAREIAATLRGAGIRVVLDDRDAYTPGWKFAEWEMRGVPLRLEIGPRDIQNNQVFSARRDTREKAPLSIDGLAATVQTLLETIQNDLLLRARTFRDEHTTWVETYDEFREAMEGRPGFVVAPWAHDAALEARVKAETQATLRNVPFSAPSPAGKPSMLGDRPAEVYAYFAKAY